MAGGDSLQLHLDESGDFFSIDTHVVCAAVVTGAVTPARMAAFEKPWEDLGLDWRAFHATGSGEAHNSDADVARWVAHLRETLVPASIGIVYVWHRSQRRYGHSFHLPLAARAIVEGWKHALPTFLATKSQSVQCTAMLELRNNLNGVVLQKRLQDSCRAVTLEADPRAPVSTSFRIGTPVKGSSPILQVADLFANAFYRARRRNDARLAALLADLPAIEVPETWLRAPAQLELQREVLTATPHAAPPARATDQARAQVIIDRAHAVYRKARTVTSDDCRALVKDLLAEPAGSRATQVSILLDALPRITDEEREYDVAEALAGVVDLLVREERARAEQPADLLDEWTMRATAAWMLVMNHRGRACAGEARVEEALAVAARLLRDPQHSAKTATLLNYVSVNLHNALDFAEAERRLGPYVEFYLGAARALPGVDLSAPWIGALFGTHAQTKAFTAHDRFFADRGASLSASLQEARELSEVATLHFTAPEDHLRHSTYQAHMYLQESLLLGGPAALGPAGDLLASTLGPEQAVAEFLEGFPTSRATDRAYRVSALLKHAWLARSKPAWFEDLVTAVLKADASIPDVHPYEQLLGYLALLSSGPARARLRKALREIGWQGLVGAIAVFFDAQLDYDESGSVTPERLTALRTAAQAALPARWLSGQLQAELERFADPRQGRAPGPLVLLPFNFC